MREVYILDGVVWKFWKHSNLIAGNVGAILQLVYQDEHHWS